MLDKYSRNREPGAVAAAAYAHAPHSRVAVLATADDVSRAYLQKAEADSRQADAAVEAGQAALARAALNEMT